MLTRVVASAGLLRNVGRNLTPAGNIVCRTFVQPKTDKDAEAPGYYKKIIHSEDGRDTLGMSWEVKDRLSIEFLNDPEHDGWDIRQCFNYLHCQDAVPDPEVIKVALNACRRVNDFALGVRFLEAVKMKCAADVKKFWPYIVQEIGPHCKELGMPLPEELGYDKPELWLPNPYDIH